MKILPEKHFKYLNFLTAFFAVTLLTSNIVSAKITTVGPFTFDGGTLFFPLAYIFGDIFTEVYGYKRTRRVIWTGFFLALFAMASIMIIGWLPAAADWNAQEAYDTILGLTPRIISASLVAYLCGEFLNSFIMAKMKIATKGKHLWARTIGSTLVGEGVDTVLFVVIAFWGVFDADLIWTILVSNYVFKVGVEVLFTPVTYWAASALKAREHEDYYDHKTDFNPFTLG